MEDLKRRILSDPLNRHVFSSKVRVFLVGGYVRDLLATGKRSRDLDYLVEGNFERLAGGVSRELCATLVNLRKQRMIRLVLSDGRTLDFSAMEGNIYRDLKGRDFTFNAIAWSPATGIIDPFQGAQDISKGRVRSILKNNFKQDPLRLLRAYRFSAQFSWYIARNTRMQIRDLSPLIRRPARERITVELVRLISSVNPEKVLSQCLADGVLQGIIPLTFKKLRRNIQLLSRIRNNLKKVPESNYLKYSFGHMDFSSLLFLEQLVHGADPSSCRLSLSGAVEKKLKTVGRMYQRFSEMKGLVDAGMFDIFREAGDSLLDLLVLTDNLELLANMKRFQRISVKPLLSAQEVMESAGLEEGPGLGRILEEMKRMQFEGLLKSKRQAEKWLQEAGA